MIKRYLPTSLFGRTLLIVMLPVLLLQIIVSFVFFDRHWSEMTERLAFAVSGEMMGVMDALDTSENINEESLKTIVNHHLELSVRIEKSDDFVNVPDADEKSTRTASRWHFEDGIRRDLGRQIARMTGLPFMITVLPEEKNVTVQFLKDGKVVVFDIPERRLFSSSSYIFILWMMAVSLFLFTIAMLFMRNQIRPIYRLGILAERMGRGIPVGRIKPSGAREVRQAAEAFIKMQDRINEFIRQRTTMLAGVSHDLKTPMTRMKLQLEMMGDTPDAEAMRNDIHDMERMIEGYLAFAKGDSAEEMERLSLKGFLDKMTEDARRLSLDVDDARSGAEDVTIWAKPTALSRAFSNFISNTARYAHRLKIETEKGEDFIIIHLHDDGEGVSDNKLQDILKPFVRGEDSRNSKTGGVGLGLTIANDIIMAHGGTLTLGRSKVLGGLLVTVTLPI